MPFPATPPSSGSLRREKGMNGTSRFGVLGALGVGRRRRSCRCFRKRTRHAFPPGPGPPPDFRGAQPSHGVCRVRPLFIGQNLWLSRRFEEGRHRAPPGGRTGHRVSRQRRRPPRAWRRGGTLTRYRPRSARPSRPELGREATQKAGSGDQGCGQPTACRIGRQHRRDCLFRHRPRMRATTRTPCHGDARKSSAPWKFAKIRFARGIPEVDPLVFTNCGGEIGSSA